jgi:putative ABC transport system permease protein
MVGRVLTHKLMRDLWRRKGSLSALIVIIMIGTMIFVAYQSVYRDLYGAWSRYSSEQRLCDAVIDVKRAPAWAVAELETISGVERVRGRVSLSTLIDLEDQIIPIAGNAISMPDSRQRWE